MPVIGCNDGWAASIDLIAPSTSPAAPIISVYQAGVRWLVS